MNFDKRDFGNIKISKTVVEDIALHSYLDFKKKDYNDVKDKREAKNNIAVELNDSSEEVQNIILKVKTTVRYGESIPHYCRLMQEKLKEDIENYTGYSVDEINVKVDDVEVIEENMYFNNDEVETTEKQKEAKKPKPKKETNKPEKKMENIKKEKKASPTKEPLKKVRKNSSEDKNIGKGKKEDKKPEIKNDAEETKKAKK